MGHDGTNRCEQVVLWIAMAGRSLYFVIFSQAMECIWSAAHFAIKAGVRLDQMAITAMDFG